MSRLLSLAVGLSALFACGNSNIAPIDEGDTDSADTDVDTDDTDTDTDTDTTDTDTDTDTDTGEIGYEAAVSVYYAGARPGLEAQSIGMAVFADQLQGYTAPLPCLFLFGPCLGPNRPTVDDTVVESTTWQVESHGSTWNPMTGVTVRAGIAVLEPSQQLGVNFFNSAIGAPSIGEATDLTISWTDGPDGWGDYLGTTPLTRPAPVRVTQPTSTSFQFTSQVVQLNWEVETLGEMYLEVKPPSGGRFVYKLANDGAYALDLVPYGVSIGETVTLTLYRVQEVTEQVNGRSVHLTGITAQTLVGTGSTP